MPVKEDPSGERSVEASVEVPGTPDEVWAAIATGQGISSWFVPSEVEEREGGTTVCHFSPDGTMDAVAKIKSWNPPHRFVAESAEAGGPSTVATEWIVEAKDGGTCVVRVVHRWFADTDEWDAQFEGHTYGWASFFRVLRLYLAHFRGQHGTSFQLMGVHDEPKEAAWSALAAPLGLTGATESTRVCSPADLPPLAGVVEYAGGPVWPEDLLVRADQPAPGLVHFMAHPMSGRVYLSLRFYLYGPAGIAAAAGAQSAWQTWLAEHFPMTS